MNPPKTKKILIQRHSQKRKTEKNSFDIAINSYAERIKQQLDDNDTLHIYDIPFVADSYLFCLLKYIYSKAYKTTEALLFIQHYLTTFQTLIVTLFKKKSMTDPKVLLAKIALFLNFEQLKQGSIICRYGDIGDKFYLIFNGKIAVLITKEHKVKMNLVDYVRYLDYLIQLKEYELALKTIISNSDIYNAKEIHEIKYNIIKHQEMSKKLNLPPNSPSRSTKAKETTYDVVNIDEYISRIIPKESVRSMIRRINSFEVIKEEEELNEVTTWIYFQVAKLEESQTFGDVALSDAISKRTASIICLEDSVFGSLDIQIYKKCIKASQEGIRKSNIECILNNPLFEGIALDAFNKKYFNYFRLVDLSFGDCLFAQGTMRTELFFLKEGEIQLITSSSLNDINNIMEYFGEKNPNKAKETKMQKKSLTLQRYFAQIKRNIKLVIYNKRNCIGLDDCMFNNYYYFITAKCKSLKASVYAIEYNFFLQMVQYEKRLERNISSYLPIRKKIMISRLKQVKDISLFSKLNAINDEFNQTEETTEANHSILTKKATSFKTSLNQNYFREKMITESDLCTSLHYIRSKRQINAKGNTNTAYIKDSSLERGDRKMPRESDALSPTHYYSSSSISRIEKNSKGKLKSIVSSPTYDRSSNFLSQNHQNSKVVPQQPKKKISLNIIRTTQPLNSKNVENIQDTTIGRYIENCQTIQETSQSNLITEVSSLFSRNKLIKLKKHLTEGLLILRDNYHFLSVDKQNTSVKNQNGLILSNVDCLAFDNAKEKSLINKETLNILKGKKIKIRLSKIKGKASK